MVNIGKCRCNLINIGDIDLLFGLDSIIRAVKMPVFVCKKPLFRYLVLLFDGDFGIYGVVWPVASCCCSFYLRQDGQNISISLFSP